MKIISYRKLSEDVDGDVIGAEPDLYLPEELWFDIFRRVPYESVFKFMCVSKRWCTMASKSFMTMPVPYIINEKVSPDFHAFRYDGFSFKFLDSKIFNYKDETTKMKKKKKKKKKKKNYEDETETTLRLLASSNGLVLFVTHSGFYNNNACYYVCNPLTKKCDTIPRPQNSRESADCSFLHGFICTEPWSSSSSASTYSTCGRRVSYKVIRIREEENPTTEFEIEIFSSGLGEWNTYLVPCPQELSWGYYYGRSFDRHRWSRSGIYASDVVTTCDDVLYWFDGYFHEKIIAYDLNHCNDKYVDHGHPQLIELPEVTDEEDINYQCLGESQGFVYYSRVEQQKPMSLSIWVLKDECKEYKSNISEAHRWLWQLVHKIELKDMLPKDKDSGFTDVDPDFEGKVIFPLAFHPMNRDVLILEYDFTYMLAYDMRIRRYEVLQTPESPDYFNPRVRCELPFLITPSAAIIPRISIVSSSPPP